MVIRGEKDMLSQFSKYFWIYFRDTDATCMWYYYNHRIGHYRL
jgi:hypothetical protein